MFYFIVNPCSKGAGKLLGPLISRLKEEGVEFEIVAEEDSGQTRSRVRALTEGGAQKVVAVGGDGTVNDVLCGLYDPARIELGIVPAGTGNDFATAARIPEGLAALDLILHTEAKYTDYIECGDGLRSMNIAGLGIDVDILQRVEAMGHGGEKSKYYRGLLASLKSYRGQKVTVSADGERETTALIAAVCNGTDFGGGIPICPQAKLDDGLLDLVLVDCPKRWKLPYYLIRLMRGTAPKLPIYHHSLVEEAVIRQETGDKVQLDGELVEAKTLSVRVVHGKLRMFRG